MSRPIDERDGCFDCRDEIRVADPIEDSEGRVWCRHCAGLILGMVDRGEGDGGAILVIRGEEIGAAGGA